MTPRIPVFHKYEPVDFKVRGREEEETSSARQKKIKVRTEDGRHVFLDLDYGRDAETYDSITLKHRRPKLSAPITSTIIGTSSQVQHVPLEAQKKPQRFRHLMGISGNGEASAESNKETTIPASSLPLTGDIDSTTKRRSLRRRHVFDPDDDVEMVSETPALTQAEDGTAEMESPEPSSPESSIQVQYRRLVPDSQRDSTLGSVAVAQPRIEEQPGSDRFVDKATHGGSRDGSEAEVIQSVTKQHTPIPQPPLETAKDRMGPPLASPDLDDENPRKRRKIDATSEAIGTRRSPVVQRPRVTIGLSQRFEVEDSDEETITVSGFIPVNARKPSEVPTLLKETEAVSPTKSVGRTASPEIETAADREYEQLTIQSDEPEDTNMDEDTHETSSEKNDCWYCHAHSTRLFTKTAGGQSFRFCSECHEQFDKDRKFATKVRHLAWQELGDTSIPKHPFFDKDRTASASVEPTKVPTAPPPPPTTLAAPKQTQPMPQARKGNEGKRSSHEDKPPSTEQQKHYQMLQQQLQQFKQSQDQAHQEHHEQRHPQQAQPQQQQPPQQTAPSNLEQESPRPVQLKLDAPGPQDLPGASRDTFGAMHNQRLKMLRLFRYSAPDQYLLLSEEDIADKRSRSKFSMLKLERLAWKEFGFDKETERFWFNYLTVLEGRDDLNKYARRVPGGGGDIVIVPVLPGGRLPDAFLKEQARRKLQAEQVNRIQSMGFEGPFILTPNGPVPVFSGSIPPHILAALSSSGFTPMFSMPSPNGSPANLITGSASPNPSISNDVSIQKSTPQVVSSRLSSANSGHATPEVPSRSSGDTPINSKVLEAAKTARNKDNAEEASQHDETEGRASVERDADILLRAAGTAGGQDGTFKSTSSGGRNIPEILGGAKFPAKLRGNSYAALSQALQVAAPNSSLPPKAFDPSTLPRPLPYRKPASTKATSPSTPAAASTVPTSAAAAFSPAAPSPISTASPIGANASPVNMPPAFRHTLGNNKEGSGKDADLKSVQGGPPKAEDIAKAINSAGLRSIRRTSDETPDQTVMRRFSYVQNSQRAALARGVNPRPALPMRSSNVEIPTKTEPAPGNVRKPRADSSHASIVAALQFGDPKAKPRTPSASVFSPSSASSLSPSLSLANTTPLESPERLQTPRPIDKASFEEVVEICIRKLNENSNIGRPLRLMLINPEKSSEPPPAMGGILSFDQNVLIAKLLHQICANPEDTLKDRPDLLAFTDIAAKMRNIAKDYGPYIAANTTR
ncbi:hypothetical protein BJ508DRAFT_415326 [Ascobolus immersus RN42]|uniref:Uncharacterized protein n=1 Tax=Ascobolus immersus RN42 TaxID=1160509 RepID=A0A3N4I3G0_ASCIM|nr:hypothetical protein BJ508DRAFT_415326 [Ascobolus immersus RN42]